MKKIKNYLIITKCDAGTVHRIVNEYIKQGYQPYGYLQVSEVLDENKTTLVYTQAMVKYEEDSE